MCMFLNFNDVRPQHCVAPGTESLLGAGQCGWVCVSALAVQAAVKRRAGAGGRAPGSAGPRCSACAPCASLCFSVTWEVLQSPFPSTSVGASGSVFVK